MASKKSSKKSKSKPKKADNTGMYVVAGVGVVALAGAGWWWMRRSAAAAEAAALPQTTAPSTVHESTTPSYPAVPAPAPNANSDLPAPQAAAANLKTYYAAGGRDPAIIRPIQQAMGSITADGIIGPATVARAQQLGISMELTAGDKRRFNVA
jgi:hypothetical protein